MSGLNNFETNYNKISIVTPSYNQGSFIEETITSVLNQNYPKIEFIVIDGGSTDNTLDVLTKYDDQLSYWVSEPDSGQGDAINKGFTIASGDIITWLNSDDLLLPHALFRVNDYFNRLPEKVGLIHGEVEMFSAGVRPYKDISYKAVNRERYLAGMAFSQPASFFRRKAYEKAGGLDPGYRYAMDYDLFSRMSLICDFVKVDDILARYRLHQESKTVKESVFFIEEWITVFNKLAIAHNLDFVTEELRSLQLFKLVDQNLSKSVSLSINENLVLFYFVSYVLKSDFWNNNLQRAKRLSEYLQSNYQWSLIGSEKDLARPVRILNRYPLFMISGLKKIKHHFRHLMQ